MQEEPIQENISVTLVDEFLDDNSIEALNNAEDFII